MFLTDFLGYTRGTAEDYDRYAKLTGDLGWSWDSLQPYFRKVGHNCTPSIVVTQLFTRTKNGLNLPIAMTLRVNSILPCMDSMESTLSALLDFRKPSTSVLFRRPKNFLTNFHLISIITLGSI